MCKIANVLGKEQDKQAYAAKYKDLNTLIHKTFYDPGQKSYATGTQIDLIYPMLVGEHRKMNSLMSEIPCIVLRKTVLTDIWQQGWWGFL